MDQRAQAIFDEARETLHRVRDVRVERRFHDDDGHLTSWSRTMPPKPAPPTMAEIEEKIADVRAFLESKIAALAPAPTVAEIEAVADDRITAVLTDAGRIDAQGKLISDERKRWRAAIGELERRLDAIERRDVVDLPSWGRARA